VVYPSALGRGTALLHRARADGDEDYVVMHDRPEGEQLRYIVDISGVAGTRLVANVVEFLDAAGTPRLRVGTPLVVDGIGKRYEARLALSGCASDDDPRPPWGRPVVNPGSRTCELSIDWTGLDVAYPIVIDPAWETTGNMAIARDSHTSTLLGSGR